MKLLFLVSIVSKVTAECMRNREVKVLVSVGKREVARCEVCRNTGRRMKQVMPTGTPSPPFDDINVVDTNERLLQEITELSSSHV